MDFLYIGMEGNTRWAICGWGVSVVFHLNLGCWHSLGLKGMGGAALAGVWSYRTVVSQMVARLENSRIPPFVVALHFLLLIFSSLWLLRSMRVSWPFSF
jgi:hypothetical protein